MRRVIERATRWRDGASGLEKGCGCTGIAVVGVLLSGFMFGSMMGDYDGPPEGAARDAQTKGWTVLLSLLGIAIAFGVGLWLISASTTGDTSDTNRGNAPLGCLLLFLSPLFLPLGMLFDQGNLPGGEGIGRVVLVLGGVVFTIGATLLAGAVNTAIRKRRNP